jgi:phosphate transport system substrate-binding protein
MKLYGTARLSATLLAVGLALSGCGGDETEGGAGGVGAGSGGPASSSGTIDIDGSSTVYRISNAAREAYGKVQPDVNVVVSNHGTGGGFGNYLKGEVDIVDASRAAKPEEESKAKAQGLDWTRFLVGTDGITVVVNLKNDFVKSLTVDQLKALWNPASTIKTWKDLDPSWPDRKIVFYSPDSDSGTFEYFTEAIVGKAKSQRDDVQPSSDDNTLVKGVAEDTDGIGYFGFAYFDAHRDQIKAVAIQKKTDGKPVAPSLDTILDKSYSPLSRPLFIYVKNSALKRPEVLAFVKFYLDNIDNLTKKAGYVTPTADEKAENAKALPGAGEKTASVAKGLQ